MDYKVITGSCFVESTQKFYTQGNVVSDSDMEPEEAANLLQRKCIEAVEKEATEDDTATKAKKK